jgi:hypothetical protein
MTMNLDVNIKRISNGFVVIGENEDVKETYYPTLESFVTGSILESIKDEDKMFREHDAEGEQIRLVASITRISEELRGDNEKKIQTHI